MKNSDAITCYVFAAAMLAVTVALLAIGYQEYRTEMKLDAEGVAVRGTIHSVKTNGRRTPVRYELDVAYTGPNGQPYTQTFFASHAAYQAASATIDVVYLPSDPMVARIESTAWWTKVVGGVPCGVIALTLGGLGLWMQLRRPTTSVPAATPATSASAGQERAPPADTVTPP